MPADGRGRAHDLWARERELAAAGVGPVAGVDEVGRGPLAGPVVAAAVILPPEFFHPRVRDSKLVPEPRRAQLAAEIEAAAVAWAVAEIPSDEIDRINILQATLRAMADAVSRLAVRPALVLVDGPRAPDAGVPCEPVVRGDRLVGCIAAASILAKAHRDRLMEAHHERWPAYNFLRNKGYGSAEHLRALREHGACPIHRRSFRGVLR